MEQHPILLFDGICNLCTASVQFLLKHDKKKQFRFGSLQSPAGIALSKQYPEAAAQNSLLLVLNGKAYTKSTAVLKMSEILGGWFLISRIGWLLPTSWRDALYALVAKNRYRFFGKKATCWTPHPSLKERFID